LRRSTLLVAGVTVVATCTGGLPSALPGAPPARGLPTATALEYGWPVQPFNREHAIRGVFGDPRTIFYGAPDLNTSLYGGGRFSFHQGIDIVTRAGEAVYAVESGTVTRLNLSSVTVDSHRGRSFQYWHLRFLVKKGQSVVARRTIIGRSPRARRHVHLVEFDRGVAVNPLQPGHLTPYGDTAKPSVTSISFRFGDGLEPQFANDVHGPVVIVAAAYDRASDGVPGFWHGLPVAPALVSWRIQRWNGRTVVPSRAAADFRQTVPLNRSFWGTYARGTFQNMAVFGRHYSWAQPGVYLFRLTRAPIDTRKRLGDGVYDVIVTATDIRGNSASLAQRFTVHNRSS